jgi:hypothetical protein
MKYLDEFRDPVKLQTFLRQIEQLAPKSRLIIPALAARSLTMDKRLSADDTCC